MSPYPKSAWLCHTAIYGEEERQRVRWECSHRLPGRQAGFALKAWLASCPGKILCWGRHIDGHEERGQTFLVSGRGIGIRWSWHGVAGAGEGRHRRGGKGRIGQGQHSISLALSVGSLFHLLLEQGRCLHLKDQSSFCWSAVPSFSCSDPEVLSSVDCFLFLWRGTSQIGPRTDSQEGLGCEIFSRMSLWVIGLWNS